MPTKNAWEGGTNPMPTNRINLKVDEPDSGLVLIGYGLFQIPKQGPAQTQTGKMHFDVAISVPTNTERVSFSVTNVHVWFGTNTAPVARAVKRIAWEISGENYKRVETDGIFEFTFETLLEGETPGEWTGIFQIEVNCFG
jgi:hypothetical protein